MLWKVLFYRGGGKKPQTFAFNAPLSGGVEAE